MLKAIKDEPDIAKAILKELKRRDLEGLIPDEPEEAEVEAN
jgi:hypothetical protein